MNENLISFKLTCRKCQAFRINRGKEFISRNVIDFDLEMTVIAKYNNQFYSYAKIIDKYNEVLHRVQFVDNSFVNIKSNDILVSEFISIN